MPEVQSARPPSTPPGAQATHWTAPGPGRTLLLTRSVTKAEIGARREAKARAGGAAAGPVDQSVPE
jgi:hypothetical protein